MRKTYPHNPRGFERNSWNYRCLQLRHALGWSQAKLAGAMGALRMTVVKLESGRVTRPSLDTIRRIKRLEKVYADIIEAYKKAPVRMSRLKHFKGGQRVYLKPIEVRRPNSITEMEEMGASGENQFFGRRTRQRMPQTGMSVFREVARRKRNKAISRAMRKKIATGWRAVYANKQVPAGQPMDGGEGQGGLDRGVHQESTKEKKS